MPLVVGILVVLFLAFVIGIWLTSHLVGLALMLLVAGFIGWLADRIVPGTLPYGWLGAIVAGLGGALIGNLILHGLGPTLFGITLIPALVGAIILAVAINLFTKLNLGR